MGMKTIIVLFWGILFSGVFCYGQEKAIRVSESDYFGADLTRFPPEVRKWIMSKAFSVEKMTKPWMLDSKLKADWSEDGNSVVAEASYTVAPGYVDAGSIEVWGQGAHYSGDRSIFRKYGEYAKYRTMKFRWEYSEYCKKLLKRDAVYAQIIAFAKKLCEELEYDWANFSAYRGAPVKRTPNKKYCVCAGYADEVMNRILQLNCVRAVQKWSSSSHAWNVIKLKDGRTLYFDLTWFDNEYINHETGYIELQEDYDWENITFDRELFYYSNIGYGSGTFHHAYGEMVEEKTR